MGKKGEHVSELDNISTLERKKNKNNTEVQKHENNEKREFVSH